MTDMAARRPTLQDLSTCKRQCVRAPASGTIGIHKAHTTAVSQNVRPLSI